MDQLFSNISHIRYNILTGKNILCSPNRNKRPWQGQIEKSDKDKTKNKAKLDYDKTCYLCPGNTRNNGNINPNYTDPFIFTNDYAALKLDTAVKLYKNSLLKAHTEKGICKVICYSPNHSKTISSLDIDDITKIIKSWIYEFNRLSELNGINNIQIFENKGEIMGCSNPHPHGQIWANYTIPDEIKVKNKFQKEYFEKTNRSLLLSYLDEEQSLNERILFQNAHFVWLVPFWAVWPFETMLIPKLPQQSINQMSEIEIRDFAEILQKVNQIYDKLFNTEFPYSSGFHQKPTDNKSYKHWQWHYSFYPPLLRSASIKKFMVGYEMFAQAQRDFTPEFSAEILRNQI